MTSGMFPANLAAARREEDVWIEEDDWAQKVYWVCSLLVVANLGLYSFTFISRLGIGAFRARHPWPGRSEALSI